jgi:hypothetical protein
MIVTNNFDDDFGEDGGRNFAHELFLLERELSAAVRQFGRAADAHDDAAKAIEVEAIADRIRRMLYVHLEIRIGMSSDAWVWLDGQENVRVELAGTEMSLSGRILCALANSLRRQWTEPFAAVVTHGSTDSGLSGYTISLGSPGTLLDLSAVERLIASGETVLPPPPKSQDGWAYIFRMDGRRT